MKQAPRRSDRRTVAVGRATVSYGPVPYGKPYIIANCPVEAIDDLISAVLQARDEIGAQGQEEATQ